jgi:signal transduction histidine kinase
MVSWLTAYQVVFAVAAVLGLVFVIAVLNYESGRGSKPLVVLFVGAVTYVVAKLVVSLLRGTPGVFVATRFTLLGSTVTATGFFLLVVEYTGVEYPISRRTAALFSVEPLLVNAAVWIDLEWVWEPVGRAPTTLSGYAWEPTVLSVANQVYLYVLGIVGVGFLIQFRLRSHDAFDGQATLLIVAALAPALANLVDVLGLLPVNPAPVAFVVSGLLVTWAIQFEGLFDLSPIGTDAVVDELATGVVTLDDDHRVVDLNDAARRTFRFDAEAPPVGRHVNDAFRDYPEFVRGYWSVTETDTQRGMAANPDAGFETVLDDRHYTVEVTVLTARDDQPLGRSLILRDVTERRAYERQLERQRDSLDLLNQMVRHDIRNDLQLVVAGAETLDREGYVDERGDEHLDTIRENARDGVELTRSARMLAEATMEPDSETGSVSLPGVLREEVRSARAIDERAVVRIEGSLPSVRVEADEMLGSVFRNLLHNAIRHNDSDDPTVVVSATEHEDRVRVRVADNGPGIRAERREAVFASGESGLDSEGTGIGLYLVDTLVTRYGGDVWLTDNEPTGSVFVVELTRADSVFE